ncbi:MAG: peptidylprolyl isomerase [Candidatus Omnitrophota bacterium]
MSMRIFSLIVSLGILFGSIGYAADGGDAVIEKGSKVLFEYTLTVDGEVVDSSKGRDPLEYVHGSGQIIPGLSKELEGMKAGDEKTVIVAAEDGYGLVNTEAFQEVPKTNLPQDIELKAGMNLQMQAAQGQIIPVKIKEVKEDSVMLDLNHPLAGKILTFEVRIISIDKEE